MCYSLVVNSIFLPVNPKPFLGKSKMSFSVVSDLQVQKREVCSDKKKKTNKSKVSFGSGTCEQETRSRF